MKAVLKFDLPEEQDDHKVALDGWRWRSVSLDMDTYLRNEVKHHEHTADELRVLDAVRGELREMVADSGLAWPE